MPPPPHHLRLLGAFDLLRDGAAVDVFGARKEEQLLAYLAVKAPTSLSRDAIAADIWPESDAATARKNLSFNLFALNKRMAEHRLDSPVDDQRKNLAISSSLEIDAMRFGEYLAQAAVTSSVAERVILLDQAASLYGGGLLPGLEFPWLTPHRDRLEALFQSTMRLLAESTTDNPALRGLIAHIPPAAWQSAQNRVQPLNPSARSLLPPSGSPARAGARSLDLAALPDLAALAMFAREAEAGLQSPTDRNAWLNRVAAREPEIEAALQQAIAAHDYAAALAIAVPLWRYWYLRQKSAVGHRWLAALLGAPYTPPEDVYAHALHACGTLAYFAGQRHAARGSLEAAIAIWQRRGDDVERLKSLTNLAIDLYGLDDLNSAHVQYAQCIALAEALDRPAELGVILRNATLCAIRLGDAPAARRMLERQLQLLGGDQAPDGATKAHVLANLAAVALLENDWPTAEARATEAQAMFTAAADDRGRSLGARLLGRVAYNRGELRQAQAFMEAAVSAARACNALPELGSSLGYLAIVLEAQGHEQPAASTMWHAVAVLRSTGDRGAINRFKAEIDVLKRSRGGDTAPAPMVL